jgi:hypothetical protein
MTPQRARSESTRPLVAAPHGKPDEFKANRDELVQEAIDDAAEQHHSRRDAPMRRKIARSF